MSEITRILTFRGNNLGIDSTLVLTFDDNSSIPGIYRDVFPIAFKVVKLMKTGPFIFTVIYKSDFAFTRAQIFSDIIGPASTYTPINVGEKTTLGKQGNPAIYFFTKPEYIDPPTGNMVAENGTNTIEDIGFGFFNETPRPPTQILLFKSVAAMSEVQLQFKPILGGYITSDYQEGEVLRGPIPTPIVFKEDLAFLPEQTNWKIEYDPATGQYKVIREL